MLKSPNLGGYRKGARRRREKENLVKDITKVILVLESECIRKKMVVTRIK